MENTCSGKITLQRREGRYDIGYGLVQSTSSSVLYEHKMLHLEEKKHLETLKYERRKHSYLLGRVAAKYSLTDMISQMPESIMISSGIFQFPIVKYLSGGNIQVSISHCKDMGIALAFPETHPMAVDVECIDDERIDAIRNEITEHEKFELNQHNLNSNQGAVLLWTIKEGLSKIFRTGLMMDFKLFEIDVLKNNEGIWESTFTHCGQYKGISTLYGKYIVSFIMPKNSTLSLDDPDSSKMFNNLSRFFAKCGS
jgi:4'-phosphopantetheinyl transferase